MVHPLPTVAHLHQPTMSPALISHLQNSMPTDNPLKAIVDLYLWDSAPLEVGVLLLKPVAAQWENSCMQLVE